MPLPALVPMLGEIAAWNLGAKLFEHALSGGSKALKGGGKAVVEGAAKAAPKGKSLLLPALAIGGAYAYNKSQEETPDGSEAFLQAMGSRQARREQSGAMLRERNLKGMLDAQDIMQALASRAESTRRVSDSDFAVTQAIGSNWDKLNQTVRPMPPDPLTLFQSLYRV